MFEATPNDSRYIPLTQQKSSCVPTCIQVVMLRHSIPLIPAEEIGYHLGLVVHPDRKNLFYNVRTSETPPPAGYGTRITEAEFEPNNAFQKLNIPLQLTIKPISQFASSKEMQDYLAFAEQESLDVLLCFNHGALLDDPTKDWGHVCVFDRLVGNEMRIVDPSPDQPKWRNVPIDKMFDAMQKHGEKKAAGLWEIKKL